MNKIFVFFFSLFFVSNLLACPYCVGNSQGGKDSNTTLVLVLFILAIYIPYYLIYRMIKKHRVLARTLNEAHDSTGSANT
jgi:cbb3-type cytochrome oxidase subunit 3